MKEFKGTKGKWEASERYEFTKNTSTIEVYVEENDKDQLGRWICQVNAISEDRKDEFEANAKLIASAPEMFEMLKDIYQQEEGISQGYHDELFKLLTKITE